MAKEEKAKDETKAAPPPAAAPSLYDQLVADINAIVDDPSETDAPRMLRRIIERVRRK